jgi:predicted pyridoxine 5'-phosphate oxidase superfamily flavin-nucleotide-binding protein
MSATLLNSIMEEQLREITEVVNKSDYKEQLTFRVKYMMQLRNKAVLYTMAHKQGAITDEVLNSDANILITLANVIKITLIESDLEAKFQKKLKLLSIEL